MLLLVSPINTKEAIEAIKGGADIIDVKNPKEGSLGASFPWIIRDIRNITPDNMLVSATLGDVPYKPGTVSLAALGALTAGADYIKVGLYGTKDSKEAVDVMKNVVRTVKEEKREAFVVAAGYADAYRVGSLDPMEVPAVASESGADVAMLDTAVKDGKTLFDFLGVDELGDFVKEAHERGLKAALAGSIKKGQLKPLYEIGCDIVGVRGAACIGGDRNTGTIDKSAVKELKKLIETI